MDNQLIPWDIVSYPSMLYIWLGLKSVAAEIRKWMNYAIKSIVGVIILALF